MTHCLLLAILRALRLQQDLAVLLLCTEDLGVQHELEALLAERALELLTATSGQPAMGNKPSRNATYAISSSIPAPPIPPKNSTTVT